MSQTPLFEERNKRSEEPGNVILYALGEFQARGKVLAERALPLDRLRGALRRAAEQFGVEEMADEEAADALQTLGAKIERRPTYFAKHPFRVTVPNELAKRAQEFYKNAERNAETRTP